MLVLVKNSGLPIRKIRSKTTIFFLPREITFRFSKMFYVYVLHSTKDKKLYVGYTKNLKVRFEDHNKGRVLSTKDRCPLKLIYYESCLNRDDAMHREVYLKSAYGKKFIKNRLKSYFMGQRF
jgi:putative endonuclease